MSIFGHNPHEHLREPTELFIDNDVLYSRERTTTQGNPIGMPMFVLATISLIKRINQGVDQIWYADDATGMPTFRDGGM